MTLSPATRIRAGTRARAAARIACLTVATLAIWPVSARAQLPAGARQSEFGRFALSAAVVHTQPVGELATGPGWGFGFGGAYALDPARIFRLAADFRVSIYDSESRDVCFSGTVGCRIVLDLTTDYAIMFVGLGPQVGIPVGNGELALDLTGGYAMFSASSRLQGVDEHEDSFGQTNNYEDGGFAWTGGGEMRFPLALGKTDGRRAYITVGARYQRNGTMSYLREGGIIDNPDGTLSFRPHNTEANLVAITLGFTGWSGRRQVD